MTIANFKQQVANNMNRTLASFTENSQDMILMAMNDTRRAAQRGHEFELNRIEDAYLATHLGGANWMTGCKTTPGGATPVQMRRIDEVWNYTTYTIGTTTYYPRTTRIPFSYTGEFKRQLSTSNILYNPAQVTNSSTVDQFAYAVGSQLFVNTVTTATSYKLIGIKFLEDLVGTEDPDIFLTYFTDWFRYATISALNVYLKDADRFPIDMNVMGHLWESVKALDGSIANMGESTNLD